jgi:carbamoyl-phosphate synthase large subunit
MINKPITVLITAVGSPLGQSITKALKVSTIPLQIIVSDMYSSAAGFFITKQKNNVILPPVSDSTFDRAIKETILKYKIDCIFPVLETEHQYFLRESEWFYNHNVRIVTMEKDILDRCYDKYECMNHLKHSGIMVPDTIIAVEGPPLESFLKTHPFPLFLKPKKGASNIHTYLITSEKQLLALLSTQEKEYFILQTYIPTLPEYTVGVYRSRDGSFERTCVIERELKFGLSYKGTVVKNAAISSYALSVAQALNLFYASNIQLRILNGTPLAFEVNPRLSSTTTVRAHFGFNEPEMILLELFDSIHSYAKSTTYGSFARGWEEYYFS